jgi:hypothetical protein
MIPTSPYKEAKGEKDKSAQQPAQTSNGNGDNRLNYIFR